MKSRYVAELKPGETLSFCNRNVPVAEIRSLARKKMTPRIGAAKGEFTVPDLFFEPMPDEWLKAFYEAPVLSSDEPRALTARPAP